MPSSPPTRQGASPGPSAPLARRTGTSTAYAKAGTGKALARESDRLDAAAHSRSVAPLTSLLSENQTALRAEMKANGFDLSKMRLPPELWYSAAEGLKTVRALAEYVTVHLNHFKQPNPILRDLKAAESLLPDHRGHRGITGRGRVTCIEDPSRAY